MCLSSWSTSFPDAGIVRLLNCSHSGMYVVISLHDFNSHFLMPNCWASFHMFTSQLHILFCKSACLNCLHILNLGLSVFFLLIYRNLFYILLFFCYLKNYPKSQSLKQICSAHSSMIEEFYKHSSGKFVPDPQLWCLGMQDLLSRQLLYSFIWSLRPLAFPSYGDLRVVHFLNGCCLPRDRKQSCKVY